jgi:hypothetical protein
MFSDGCEDVNGEATRLREIDGDELDAALHERLTGRAAAALDSMPSARLVAEYLNGGSWELLAEFTEVESGKRNDRPELARALDLCRRQKATLIIAKLDRLARNVAFVANPVLNARGIRTARGGSWYATTVKNLLERQTIENSPGR